MGMSVPFHPDTLCWTVSRVSIEQTMRNERSFAVCNMVRTSDAHDEDEGSVKKECDGWKFFSAFFFHLPISLSYPFHFPSFSHTPHFYYSSFLRSFPSVFFLFSPFISTFPSTITNPTTHSITLSRILSLLISITLCQSLYSLIYTHSGLTLYLHCYINPNRKSPFVLQPHSIPSQSKAYSFHCFIPFRFYISRGSSTPIKRFVSIVLINVYVCPLNSSDSPGF